VKHIFVGGGWGGVQQNNLKNWSCQVDFFWNQTTVLEGGKNSPGFTSE